MLFPHKKSGKHHWKIPEYIEHDLTEKTVLIRYQSVQQCIDDTEKITAHFAFTGNQGIACSGQGGNCSGNRIFHPKRYDKRGSKTESKPCCFTFAPAGKFSEYKTLNFVHRKNSFIKIYRQIIYPHHTTIAKRFSLRRKFIFSSKQDAHPSMT